MTITQTSSRLRCTPSLTPGRRPSRGRSLRVFTAAAFLLLAPLPSYASWSDTDSDGNYDTWTDPATSQVYTIADLDNISPDTDADGVGNSAEAAAGSNPFAGDTDLDGFFDSYDPFPIDALNYSPINGLTWKGDVLGDFDYDTIPNWQETDADVDMDGWNNAWDPAPTDPYNWSPNNGYLWYGDALSDNDSDGIANWYDLTPYPPVPDSDGDGFLDSEDPYPYDHTNYSSTNNISWYGDMKGDADSDGTENWQDATPYPPDADGDGITDAADPYPNDSTNFSSTNGITWYGNVNGDLDSDGTPNWNDPSPDADTDGDGFMDFQDPYPSDNTNYSSINGFAWYGDVYGDNDNDGTPNWEDATPNT
jgi:hypothetical protein